MPVGDEADAVGRAVVVVPVVPQVPEAFPMTPPPSKTAVEPDVAEAELPVLEDEIPVPENVPVVVFAVESDVPIVKFTVGVDVPIAELEEPKDACGSEPPKPAHDAVLPDKAAVAGPTGETPDVVGLRPADPSSVAPRPIPVGATGAPTPMPSGEVMPRGEGPGAPVATCASAELQPNRAVATAAINKRVIVVTPRTEFAGLIRSSGDKPSA